MEKGVSIWDRLENFCWPFCPHSFLVPLTSLIHWVAPSSPGGSCNNSLFMFADTSAKLGPYKVASIHRIGFKCSVTITGHHKPQIATIPAPYVGQKWTWMWFRASNMCGKCLRWPLIAFASKKYRWQCQTNTTVVLAFKTNDLLTWTMNTTIDLKIQRAIWWIRLR